MFTLPAKPIPSRSVEDPPLHLSYIPIPDEFLVHVMQPTASNPGLPRNFFSATLRLPRVSRHFRSIAHSTSELWTLIYPNFPMTDDQVLFWLDVLARSKAKLIDVVVNVQTETTAATKPYKVFIGAAVNLSDRWRKFEIKSDTWGQSTSSWANPAAWSFCQGWNS